MDNKTRFQNIVRESIHRDGVDDLMDWLDRSDFYVAPASTRYHSSYAGGLCDHSIVVYNRLLELIDFYGYGKDLSEAERRESAAIVALFHDLCKVGYYKVEMRWRKDKNQRWEQYPTYKVEEDFPFGGHGSKSMYLVQNFIKLLPVEAAAINCHMGQWDATTYSNPSRCYESNLLAWLLHVADEAATYLDKK